jgi:hypothetical protein
VRILGSAWTEFRRLSRVDSLFETVLLIKPVGDAMKLDISSAIPANWIRYSLMLDPRRCIKITSRCSRFIGV